MTTWELATDSQKWEIQRLLDSRERANKEPPPLPTTAQQPGLTGLTKKDAGMLLTLLREAE